MTVHSIYAPSSIGDKMKCPGRHLATLGLDNETSSYAERGTEVHEYADELLTAGLNGITVDPPDFPEDWQEDCAKDMVDHSLSMMEAMERSGPVRILTEQQVSLGEYKSEHFDMSQVFGTVDVVFYCEETQVLTVIDYKSGQGVAVSPTNNVQLSIYALGAAKSFGLPVDKINVCISQPRIEPSLQIWETTFSHLEFWLYDKLIPALVEMTSPEAKFVPGESQCRWCAIKGRCKAQRDEMLSLFDTPKVNGTDAEPTFSDSEIDSLMLRLPEFKQWLGQLEEAGMTALQGGRDLPSYKLVNGKSHRKWIDVDKADTWLRGQKLTQKQRYNMKLLSPAQVEKALKDTLKNKTKQTNFSKLVHKPVGKESYALKTDPRPAIIVNKTEMLVNLEDLL